jgi:hypothetical protein
MTTKRNSNKVCADFGQQSIVGTIARTHNSGVKKLAVQWLNEVQFFNQTFVQVDSFVLRNRQLLIAAKRQTV